MQRCLIQSEKQSLSDISVQYNHHGIGLRNSVENIVLKFHGHNMSDSEEMVLIRRESVPEDFWRAIQGMRSFGAVEEAGEDSLLMGYPLLEALMNLLLGMLEALLAEDRDYFGRRSKRPLRPTGESHELALWTPEL